MGKTRKQNQQSKLANVFMHSVHAEGNISHHTVTCESWHSTFIPQIESTAYVKYCNGHDKASTMCKCSTALLHMRM